MNLYLSKSKTYHNLITGGLAADIEAAIPSARAAWFSGHHYNADQMLKGRDGYIFAGSWGSCAMALGDEPAHKTRFYRCREDEVRIEQLYTDGKCGKGIYTELMYIIQNVKRNVPIWFVNSSVKGLDRVVKIMSKDLELLDVSNFDERNWAEYVDFYIPIPKENSTYIVEASIIGIGKSDPLIADIKKHFEIEDEFKDGEELDADTLFTTPSNNSKVTTTDSVDSFMGTFMATGVVVTTPDLGLEPPIDTKRRRLLLRKR